MAVRACEIAAHRVARSFCIVDAVMFMVASRQLSKCVASLYREKATRREHRGCADVRGRQCRPRRNQKLCSEPRQNVGRDGRHDVAPYVLVSRRVAFSL